MTRDQAISWICDAVRTIAPDSAADFVEEVCLILQETDGVRSSDLEPTEEEIG